MHISLYLGWKWFPVFTKYARWASNFGMRKCKFIFKVNLDINQESMWIPLVKIKQRLKIWWMFILKLSCLIRYGTSLESLKMWTNLRSTQKNLSNWYFFHAKFNGSRKRWQLFAYRDRPTRYFRLWFFQEGPLTRCLKAFRIWLRIQDVRDFLLTPAIVYKGESILPVLYTMESHYSPHPL